MRKGYLVFGSLILLLFLTNLYAGEVKVTTYYPAPYGRYDTVHTNQLGVGSTLTSTDLGNLEDGEIGVTGAAAGPYFGSGWGNAISLPKDRIILWGGDTMMGVDSGTSTFWIGQPTDYMSINTSDANIYSTNTWVRGRLYFCAW